uniref:Uncharacterized protein n=1 Tax=Oryza glaberrima TaxID=4538 RepID=I1P407_ORYGL
MGTPAVVDDDLRELIDELMNTGPEDEADNRDFEESMATVLSMVTDYLDDPDPPSPELADWAAAAESGAQKVADGLASRVENLRRGLSVFAGTGRPEEAVLRKHAAWTDARRLREKDLRSLAARGGLVNPRMAELIASVSDAMESDVRHGHVPSPAQLAEVERLEGRVAVASVRAILLKVKLTRGAAAFAGRPGEEALAQALRGHAAAGEAQLAAARAFAGALRRFRALSADANSNPTATRVHKRPSPETEDDLAAPPPRQRRRTLDSGVQD